MKWAVLLIRKGGTEQAPSPSRDLPLLVKGEREFVYYSLYDDYNRYTSCKSMFGYPWGTYHT